MSVFDKLKSTFKESDAPHARKASKETSSSAAIAPSKRNNASVAPLVLQRPHISEKASEYAHRSVYVFRIAPRANKIDVSHAVASLYNVQVRDVRIINVKSKTRRLGRIVGKVPGYKKAMVVLAAGSKIDVSAQ